MGRTIENMFGQRIGQWRIAACAGLLAVTQTTSFCDGYAGASGTDPVAFRKAVQDEKTRRMDLVIESQRALSEGAKLYAAREYTASATRFRWVLDNLPMSPNTYSTLQNAAVGLVSANMHLAEEAVAKGDWERAKALALEGLEFDPENRRLKEILELSSKALDPYSGVPAYQINTAMTPEFIRAIHRVQELLYEGDRLRDTGQVDKAVDRYRQVLVIDPYNELARESLQRMAMVKKEYYDVARLHTREEALLQVEETWSTPIKRSVLKEAGIETAIPTYLSNIAKLTEKLNGITIDKIQLEEATVPEAIDFLRAKSKALDSEGKGINFVLKSSSMASSGEGAEATMAITDALADKKITLTLEALPLYNVLELVAKQADLKFKVEEHAIVIAPAVENLDTLVTREFRVPPDFVSTKIEVGTETGGALDADVKFFREEVRKKLESFGVQFPPGATAVLLPSGNKLVVRNSPANLDLIEEALRGQEEVVPQVEVEAKFLEINQDDIDELSFRWNINKNDRGQSQLTDTPGLRTSLPRIYENAVPTDLWVANNAVGIGSLDQLLARAASIAAGPIGNTLQTAMTISPWDMEVLVYALSQKTQHDLMAAPKVTVKSGQEAEIKVIRQFFYPEEFEEPEIESSQSSLGFDAIGGGFYRNVTPSTPTSFEKEEIGVALTVNPAVGPDNLTIDLTLVPRIVEFDGFINYGTPIYSIDINNPDENSNQILLTQNYINKPVFSVRQVETKVQVTDGQTVVLGGLISEQMQKVDDKIPFFGDIPLVGRLFRSKIEQSLKKNLLVFVTCHLVKPDGEPFNRKFFDDPNSFKNWPTFCEIERAQPLRRQPVAFEPGPDKKMVDDAAAMGSK